MSVEQLRQRIANCRRGMMEARKTNGPGLHTYRLLYAGWYVGYKNQLKQVMAKP